MLDSIDTTTPAGLRDRALIALMVYSFALVGAALAMKVEDVFVRDADTKDDGDERAARCDYSDTGRGVEEAQIYARSLLERMHATTRCNRAEHL